MKTVILGSGNVATILGKALSEVGYDIAQVWSRNKKHAESLATVFQAQPIDDLKQIDPTADLYIIAVSDDGIQTLLSQINPYKGIVVHTSGSTPMDIFKNKFSRYGVFYPFQTFSKEREISFKEIPILLESSDHKTLSVLKDIASSISTNVQECSSDQRKALHIAAVFACNFTNHLYVIAKKLLEAHKLDFDLLRPLIAETALKVQESNPEQVQTGPAIRKDFTIIDSHLELLKEQPELLTLYRLLSDRIIASASEN